MADPVRGGRLLAATTTGLIVGERPTEDVGALRLVWGEGGTLDGRDVGSAAVGEVDRRFAVLLDRELPAGGQVRLATVVGGTRREVDAVSVGEACVVIEAVYDDGSIVGWSLGGPDDARLDIILDGKRIGSVLADRFSPEWSTPNRTIFHDFWLRVPFALLAMSPATAELAVYSADTGEKLFEARFASLRRPGVPQIAALPIDAIAPAEPEMVIDVRGVRLFLKRHGIARFVDAAYHYMLERAPDVEGRKNFIDAIVQGAISPEELLATMYASDERIKRGALMGPFVGDPDYPFRAADTPASSVSPSSVDVEPRPALQTSDTARLLPIGEAISFKGEQSRDFLVSGWGDPEPEWRWLLGTSGVVRFAVADPASLARIHLACRSIGPLPSANTVVLSLNGVALGEERLEDENWMELAFTVPPGVARESNELWIDTGQATSVPGDHRLLTLCVREMELIAR